MSRILAKTTLAPQIHQFVVAAPRIAASALPGQFVVVMADEAAERIPLTIADFDRQAGTITMVLMVVGTSSFKLAQMKTGDAFFALLGPLGAASHVEKHDSVIMVAGGLGAAPVYPIARAFHEAGSRVITIQGSRTRDLLFWTDELAAISHQHVVTTDDGTAGRRGLVTDPLREILAADAEKRVGCVYAIGPTAMMKFCAKATEPFGVKTIVSLNSIMVDGTGMCGGCRVQVGGENRFTCVDGPEFDGHQVDWETLLSRQKTYRRHEDCSYEQMLRMYEARSEEAQPTPGQPRSHAGAIAGPAN
jgi:ferredoxin--NADP+ reductase